VKREPLSKKKFRKSVESIRRQIEIHYEKVSTEQKKSAPDANLIRYWHKEISGLQKSLARAEKRLRRGK
jgi:hypothetical protein